MSNEQDGESEDYLKALNDLDSEKRRRLMFNDFQPDLEGDCTWCDGTGEIVCDACQGSGCKRCLDGNRTCPNCQGSGFQEDDDPGDY